VPYTTVNLLMGATPLTRRYTNTVFTDGLAPAMVRGTDIGPLIPHVGPPSLTLILEILFSGSKSHFGVASVQVKDQWGAAGNLGVALLGYVNPNLNCGYPMPTPFGVVIAPTTHVQSMTLGDFVAGVYLMTWDFALQSILNKAGGPLSSMFGRAAGGIARRLGVGMLGRTAARQAARAQGVRRNMGPTARALQEASRARLAAVVQNSTIYGWSPFGFVVGTPLGMSVSNVRDLDGEQLTPSGSDRLGSLLDVEGNADSFGRAVDDYFNGPGAEEIPPSAPPSPVPTSPTPGDSGTGTPR
jgi:hypothetical protein